MFGKVNQNGVVAASAARQLTDADASGQSVTAAVPPAGVAPAAAPIVPVGPLDLAAVDQWLAELKRRMRARDTLLRAQRDRGVQLQDRLRPLKERRNAQILHALGLDSTAFQELRAEQTRIVSQDYAQFMQTPPPEGLAE